MINNLVIHDVNKWKDVDDTIAEIVPRNNKSDAQNAINAVDNWSGELDATELIGTDKCKEGTLSNRCQKVGGRFCLNLILIFLTPWF
jgi:hypothetical protein